MGSSPTSGTTPWTSVHQLHRDDGFASGKLIDGHEFSPCGPRPEAHAADALDEQPDSSEQCGEELNRVEIDTVVDAFTFQRVATVHGLITSSHVSGRASVG